ncbi:unnamed protein product [Dibothriocephalus latus]|uniref:Uncharacterized protein n=1 Tax=Dibothriocephalus latus TaxID=60516 RepID=A0A3P7RDS9_DIBLA|nr:unnamed protein product [Dibothriocephalus latus]
MRMTETAVNLLNVNLDSPKEMLKLHLGLPWEQSGLPNSLHALVCAVVVVMKTDQSTGQQARGQRRASSAASSPLVLATLAVSTAAFVLRQQQQQEPRTGEVLSDRFVQQLNLLISDEPSSSSSGLNFPFMHIYFQLQIAYATLVTLGAVLIASMDSEGEQDHEELGSLDTVSSCFPSGRLVHRLAVRLDRLAQSDREKEVCGVIFPRLLGRPSMRTGSVQPLSQAALSQVISTFKNVIRSTDALLKGQ